MALFTIMGLFHSKMGCSFVYSAGPKTRATLASAYAKKIKKNHLQEVIS